jgi:GNAT superfamily N-acetyltransferase
MQEISFYVSKPIDSEALNSLFAAAWENHQETDFQPVLSRSLLYVCAYTDDHLIGFVNMAWDGGVHAFLLDTTVHPDFQRQGIGVELVRKAAEATRERGVEWVHVDYEPHLEAFYRKCGFQPTLAGLINLRE